MSGLAMSDHEWEMYELPTPGSHYWHDKTGFTVDRIEEIDDETLVHLMRDPDWERAMADGLHDGQ